MQYPHSGSGWPQFADSKVAGSTRASSPSLSDNATMSGISPLHLLTPLSPPPLDLVPPRHTTPRPRMDHLPPLPPIEGELMLEVYTHKSLDNEPGAVTADEHGGSSRLATLGESVLQSVVMICLFRRQPMYNAAQLNGLTADCVSNASVDRWAIGYGLRNKVRCAPAVVPRLGDAEEGYTLFVSYVGAICIQSGYNVVQDWISQLLEASMGRM